MKLTKLIITNFRGYKNRTEVGFNDITTFVGKNDSGKSTILEALDIFFNDGKGCIKIDNQDINIENKNGNDTDIAIEACFTDLPAEIVIDASNKTSLKNEYLLNDDGTLHIEKIFSNASSKAKVYIIAKHPNNPNCNDLMQLKIADLKKKVKELNIEDKVTDKTVSAAFRAAIWSYYDHEEGLSLANRKIDVSKGETKSIWEQIEKYLPIYSLFQSDRSNSDSDNEVQDPLKHAVKEFLMEKDVQEKLNSIAQDVIRKLEDVSRRTLEKLQEMDASVANTLEPSIPDPNKLKWAEVFKSVSITGDEDIPINKRGSGVRRLILLNFFRVEAERKLREQASGNSTASIIYAIEEPETSQHFQNQLLLVKAFKDLSSIPNVQVILTTHSGNIVKQLDFEDIRLVDNGKVIHIHKQCLPFPSLNEVNFVAFDEATEEYHDELFGYIESNNLKKEYECEYNNQIGTLEYHKLLPNGNQKQETLSLTLYIRHQIHHPENTENVRYTREQLKSSISAMRSFIQAHPMSEG